MSTVEGGGNIITDGLASYLDAANTKSYPTTGTIWTDLSRGGNNGTLINGSTFNSANLGSIQFDGTNDYVTIPDNSTQRSQNFTLSVWVRFNAFRPFNTLITKPQFAPPWPPPFLSWLLRVNSSNQLEFSIGSSTTFFLSNATFNFSLDTIYNIVGTYDGTTLRAYINTSLVITSAVSTTINYTSQPIIVGAGHGTNPIGNDVMNGSIYSVSVYNRALTSQEVLKNFNVIRSRFGI
jgi:hypothetical protein